MPKSGTPASGGLRRVRIYCADAQKIPGGRATDLPGRQNLDDGAGGLGGLTNSLPNKRMHKGYLRLSEQTMQHEQLKVAAIAQGFLYRDPLLNMRYLKLKPPGVVLVKAD